MLRKISVAAALAIGLSGCYPYADVGITSGRPVTGGYVVPTPVYTPYPVYTPTPARYPVYYGHPYPRHVPRCYHRCY